MPRSASTSRSDPSRTALIAAALDLFGRHGFDAVSTRTIAAAANANIAAIAYHFGGKEGLREACAAHLVALFSGLVERAQGGKADPVSLSQPEAEAQLLDMFSTFAGFLAARPEAEAIARFMVREHLDPSSAFEAVYAGSIHPLHERLTGLFARASGRDPFEDAVRLAILSLVGSVVYFRLGRPVVLRRLGWADLREPETAAIIATVRAHVAAIVALHRKG